MIAHTRFGFAPDTVIPMLPRSPVGRPGLREMSVHVSPPSRLVYSAEPGPPETSIHGVRPACQKVAYSTFGFDGSITRSLAPVESLRKRIFCQLLPPSLDL